MSEEKFVPARHWFTEEAAVRLEAIANSRDGLDISIKRLRGVWTVVDRNRCDTGMVVAITVRDTDLEAALAAVQSVRT